MNWIYILFYKENETEEDRRTRMATYKQRIVDGIHKKIEYLRSKMNAGLMPKKRQYGRVEYECQ